MTGVSGTKRVCEGCVREGGATVTGVSWKEEVLERVCQEWRQSCDRCVRDGGGLVTGVAPHTMQPGSLWAQTTSGESPTCQLLV